MNAIQQWLDGPRDYEAGRLLYEQHGRNAVLKRTLSHGPSVYNRSAVREELVKLAASVVVPADFVVLGWQPGPPDKTVTATPDYAHPGVKHDLIAGLEKQWKPLYKEASFLQSQLGGAKDNTERAKLAHSILNTMDKVQELWEASDYVKEHGKLLPVPKVVPPAVLDLSNAVAVLKCRNNLRAQISKQKRNAERAADVAAWEAEVKQLDKVLKKLTK